MTPERQVVEAELAAAPAAPAAPTTRRTRGALATIGAAVGLGAVLQPLLPRGNAVAAAVGAGTTILFLAVARVMSARARRSLVQQEGFAAVLAAIAIASIAGSLVPQKQPGAFYLGTYEAVRDPGAFWVLLGFAVIAAGVIHLLYVHPRLRAPRG